MNKIFNILNIIFALTLFSCDDTVRDITGSKPTNPTNPGLTEVIPVDINTDGFDFLDKVQGQWIGSNLVINTDYPFFVFDYRAVSDSHIHAIHEGGSQGNLFNSFYVTNYKGKRTIMARNGGVLNGLYRTSYFVMDSISNISANEKFYRFVDAIGGKNLMRYEMRFKNDSLYWNAYTSNLGLRGLPTRHMTFKAVKNITDLAQTAATAANFPQNSVNTGLDFSNGFNNNNLYVVPSNQSATTATFLAQQQGLNDVYQLAALSGDPYIITQYPRLGTLLVNFTRNTNIQNTDIHLYLTKEPLTDTNGFFTGNANAYSSILHFPIIEKADTATSFFFTYLHPSDYYLTVFSDTNGDFNPGQGDIVSPSRKITIAPLENKTENVNNINVQN